MITSMQERDQRGRGQGFLRQKRQQLNLQLKEIKNKTSLTEKNLI